MLPTKILKTSSSHPPLGIFKISFYISYIHIPQTHIFCSLKITEITYFNCDQKEHYAINCSKSQKDILEN